MYIPFWMILLICYFIAYVIFRSEEDEEKWKRGK